MIGLPAVPASAATTLRLTVSGLPSGATAEAARPYVGGPATGVAPYQCDYIMTVRPAGDRRPAGGRDF